MITVMVRIGGGQCMKERGEKSVNRRGCSTVLVYEEEGGYYKCINGRE